MGHEGGCHCGNLRFQLETTKALADFSPRACDCDFCTRHRAAWVSDRHGRLHVRARDLQGLHRYRQGSGQAEFLSCAACAVLVAVVARSEDDRLLGAANRNAFDGRVDFAPETSVSPQTLAADAKLARWTELWTPVELSAG